MRSLSINITSNLLLEGDLRLDATYYESTVRVAKAVLFSAQKNGIEVSPLSSFSDGTFNPPPIKRAYTDNVKLGTAYMLPQEMFDFYWMPKKYVLANKMANIDDWYLKKGWIVLTQSGTVGKPYYVTKGDEGVVLSQNAIRIPVSNDEIGGYLYAYLSTWIGQTLLKKDEFGITVKHIRPHQVDEIPVPKLSPEKMKAIGKKVKKAFELRTQAIKLLNEAKQAIYEELGVEEIILDEDEE